MSSFRDLVKKVNEEEETKKKEGKTTSSFADLVRGVNDGSIRVDSRLDSTAVTDWYKNVQDIGQKGYNFLSTEGYKTLAPDDELLTKTSALLESSRDIEQYFRANKFNIADYDKVYSGYVDTVNYLSSLQKSLEETNNYYSTWDSAEDYNKAVEYNEMINSRQAQQGWARYRNSQNVIVQETEEEKPSFLEKIGYYLSQGTSDTSLPMGTMNAAIDAYRTDDSYKKPNENWTREQEKVFGYLYYEDPAKAYQYAIEVNNSANQVKEAEKLKKIQESANSSWYSGALNTLGAIFAAPLGLADYLNDLAMINAGRPITSDGNISPFEYSQAVTQGIADNLNEKSGTLNENIPIIGGKGAGDLYQLGTSIAQSLTSAYTLGGGGTLISYFGQGAASGVDDALSRGATEGQAVLYGTALGVFEGLAEQIGIDNLFKLGSSATAKGFIKNILKQAGVEGAEEGLTSLFTNIADNVIMQDKSNFNALVEKYVAQGMSESDAKKKAWMDSVEGIAFDTIAGAVSGGVSGSLHTSVANIIANKEASQLYGNGADLVTEAKELGGEAGSLADKYQAKLDKGKSLSGGQINRLIEANENAIVSQDKGKMQTAAESRLTELGETGDVSAIAKAIVKQASGEKLTKSEQTLLQNSKYGQRVSNEISPSNVGSGKYSNAWAESIGTDRINTEAYNMGLYDLAREVVAPTTPKSNTEATSQGNTLAVNELSASTEGKSSTSNENLAESEFEVSADGKTINKKSDDIISIIGIESIKDGEMVLKVKNSDGETESVNAKDVAYGSNDDVLIYSAVADMGASETAAWNIVKNFKATDGVSANVYAQSVPFAYKYGVLNYRDGLSRLDLTPEQAMVAFFQGRNDAEAKLKRKTNKPSITTAKNGTVSKGKVIFEGFKYNEKKANANQKASMAAINFIAEISPLEIHVYESKRENGQYVAYINGKKRIAPNGYFIEGTNKIYIDINAGNNGEGLMLDTSGHEITHYIAEWNWEGFKELGDFLFEHYGADVPVDTLINNEKNKIIESYKRDGKDIPSEDVLFKKAYEEVVANAMSKMLADERAYTKLAELKQQNHTLWEKLGEAIKNLLDKIKSLIGAYSNEKFISEDTKYVMEFSKDVYEKLQDLYIKAFVEANEVVATLMAEGSDATGDTDIDGAEGDHILSDRTMVEGAGLRFVPTKMDGKRVLEYRVEDTEGNAVTEVDEEMIKNSPLGNIVTAAVEGKYISEADAEKQYKFLAELVNMCLQYKGIAPIWETAGTLVFSAIKNNADKQYGKTIDFSTVCKKTQAIVDAMSGAMLKLGRGLTRAEVETIYLEVGKAGEETPCPVCYVFSRWMGIGGILDQMNRFQNKYVSMKDADIRAFMEDIEDRIEKRANTPNNKGELKAAFFDKDGNIKQGQVIADLKGKASSRAASALKSLAKNSDIKLQIQELEALMQTQDEKGKKATNKKIEKLNKKLTDVSKAESIMKEANDEVELYEAYQWLTRTLMVQDANGNWVRNKDFKSVPMEVLFDLNKGDEFASGYPLSWAFRTGKGASAGKAIMPYADARVGETIQGIAKSDIKDIQVGLDLNPFLNGDSKAQKKLLASARLKQRIQNLIGGMRYQSTSDFRYEYGSDYLITVLEMQAIGAKVQLYTKVIEAVDFLATVGAECNLSVMPLSDGYITLEDGTKKLVYSSVTGINGKAAIEKTHQYNNVQLILVGISDEHIRLALEGDEVTFVIPFHGSGNSVHQIQALMNLLGENLDVTKAKDYTAVQSDHHLKNKTQAQKDAWELRKKIVMGNAENLTAEEYSILKGNDFLDDLYRRFYVDKNSEEYGVALSKDQAEQIFPYEYWDKSLSYDQADQNGERFKQYCETLGIIPRFSGVDSDGKNVGFGDFTNTKGYWKLLIDRRMYENVYDADGNWEGYGNYHTPQTIDVTNFKAETIDPAWGTAHYGEVMAKSNDPKKTNKIVDAAIAQFENKGETMFSDRDSKGNTLSKEQQEYFKDSKVRDEDGNLLVMYHGTANSGPFTVFDGDKLANSPLTSQIGQGFYFTNVKKEAKAYTKNMDGYGRMSAGRNPHLFQVYLNITNPFDISSDTLDIEKVKSVYMDGTNERFFDEWIPHYLNGKTLNGRTFTKTEIQSMTKATKVSVYVDYLSILYSGKEFTAKELMSNMVRAFPFEKQSELLEAMRNRLGYDGFVEEFAPGQYQYVALSPEQIKAVDNKTPTSDPDIRYSERDYSYDALVSKSDMVVTTVNDKVTYKPTSTIRKNLVNQAIKNAASLGITNENGNVVIHVDDIDTDVLLSKPSLAHGLDRRLEISAPVILNIGSVLKNSIRINELTPKKQSAIGSYVLIGYAESNDYAYPVRMVVNQYTNVVDTIDVLYAVNTKKETVGKMPGSHGNAALPTVSTISISNLLDFVNKYFPDVLPESVWKHYKHTERPKGDLGRSALYSERDPSASNRAILANALEGVAQNDIEKNKLKEYKEKISLIESEEKRLSEIQKQLFTKGGVDTENRKALQFEAKQISNRINTYDRQLLRLEATKPLQDVLTREKNLAMKRQKQKDAEAMQKYKEKVAKTQRELITRNQESRKKAIESREKTAMRHKIQKVVSDLNSLLLKPTKERHVPEEMKIAVAEALNLVNLDTVDADTRVSKYNDLIAKAKDPDVIASLTATRDRILEQGNKLSEKLSKLKEAYSLVRDSADDSLRSMYDDVIYNKIESVQQKVGKTPIRNMTLEQLESVYELYKMVLTAVRDSNKAFAEDLKMTRQELGSNTFAEIKDNNKVRDTIKHLSLEKFLWQNLKPMQAMKTIGSGTLQKLWNNILYGQEVFAQDYDEAVKFAKEMKDKYGYEKWDTKKLYSFESKSGKTMKISLEQMMSIYAYSKRKQADEHIEFGGIVLNEGIIEEKNKLGKTVKVKVNDSTAYRLNKLQVAQIIETLEKEAPGAKAFVDEMQKYLSETMGAKGNEVAMKMYGIRLFKEEHYFPLKSSKDFMEAANAKLKGDVKIKNKGMTKAVVEHASNPIVLENFLDVWGNHINEMAMYHGLVLPLEDFSRTLNYSFKADEDLNTDAESVRTALHDAFGDNADNYLNELLKAINGGVLHDSSAEFADKMISKFKKAKVMASLSVIIQQPTAIVRAMSIIEPKYFVAQNFNHKATWEELKKYCPTAIIKETGSFDTNMGRTIVDMIKDEQSFTDKVGDALGKAPAWMDEMGWNMIWRALKKKVAAEQKLSGEELLKECGKQMTLIINETQVYDSVMSRNELMRSKSAFTKMATAFMAEPTTVANMIYGAGLDFKRGKKGMAGKTVAAVISSVVVNGLVSAIVYALRDDDEDETFLEKYLSAATTEVIDGLNPLTYIPFIKDAYSLFQGYKVERTDMALIGDVYDAVNTFYNALDPEAYEGMSREEIAKHIFENSVPLLTSICDMFGLPVGNILKDAKAIIINDNVPMSQASSTGTKYAFKEGLMSTLPKIVQKIIGTDTKQDKLYDAIVSGDTAYVDRLKSGYKDEKAYETAVRKALRENDPRVKEAAEARINGDIAEYTRIVKEIKAEGFFSQDTIVASVNAEINAINKGESSSSNSTTEDKASSIYKMDDYYASIVGGDQATAYVVKEDIISIDVANGKTRDEAEDSFNSRFASIVREQYENGYLSGREAQDMLVNYGDKSEEDAASKVQYWEFKQEYPDYDDLSEEAVTKYYNEVEPYGISVDVYYDYSKQRSKCKGTDKNGDGKTDSGSVKAEILRVINSLPISRSQKDVLYYLNGWSSKTINEAPWH